VPFHCTYCSRSRDEDADARSAAVEEGMCDECVAAFRPFWEGMALADYLERFDVPVLVADGTGRVVACNARGATQLGRDRNDIVGRLAGDAIACVNSRLPGGCGQTVHCRECTLRGAIDAVQKSGRPVEGVAAYLDTALGRVPLRVSAAPVGGAVRVLIEEVGPAKAAGK
jgi:PAS domain-containing protein